MQRMVATQAGEGNWAQSSKTLTCRLRNSFTGFVLGRVGGSLELPLAWSAVSGCSPGSSSVRTRFGRGTSGPGRHQGSSQEAPEKQTD